MTYCVDTNEQFNIAKKKYLRYSLLFAGILTVVLLADTLLVLLAGENYTLNYIFATLITVLFSWFAIYFFTAIYKDINFNYRYFKGIDSGLTQNGEVVFLSKEDTLSQVNGLYVYPLHVKYIDGLNEEEKIIFSIDGNIYFEKGDKLTISTYQRILLKAERHK